MKVKDLIKKLSDMPMDAEVHICMGYITKDGTDDYDYDKVSNVFKDTLFDEPIVMIENNVWNR